MDCRHPYLQNTLVHFQRLGETILVGKGLEGLPGGVFNGNAFAEQSLLSQVLKFAGIEDFREASRRRSALEVLRKFGHFLLEFLNRAEGVHVERS